MGGHRRGVPILILLNLARLVHLFYIGVYRPDLFKFFHERLWDNCLILCIIILWLSWLRWSEALQTDRLVRHIPAKKHRNRIAVRDDGGLPPPSPSRRHWPFSASE